MLRGNYMATVDAKGRLKIPTAFKEFLDKNYGPDFFVTSIDGKSTHVYPFSVWRGFEDKLIALPHMNRARKKLLDRANYWGQTVRADAQGRLLIPAQLRASAAMQGEVAVVGNLNYLDVWNADRFREQLENDPLTPEDEKTLSDLGI